MNIVPEITHKSESFMLDLSLAFECAFHGPRSFEPFPSFLLKNKEIRSKCGYIDNISEAKKKGSKEKAKTTDDSNKDLQRIFEIYKHYLPVPKLLELVHDDGELKEYFKS